MKYKAVIFDMDGTILDTLDDLWDSLNAVFEAKGYPVRTREEVRRFVGNGIHRLIERAVPEGTSEAKVEDAFLTFKEYYQEHCAIKTKPYDGILELLHTLKEKGYKLAVVSNKADGAVQELCKEYFPQMFSCAIGEKPKIHRKPAPDSVLEAVKQLGVEVKDAIYVGDSEVDIQTSNNANMDHIIVTWGFRDKEFLKEEGAKVFVKEPNEILQIV